MNELSTEADAGIDLDGRVTQLPIEDEDIIEIEEEEEVDEEEVEEEEEEEKEVHFTSTWKAFLGQLDSSLEQPPNMPSLSVPCYISHPCSSPCAKQCNPCICSAACAPELPVGVKVSSPCKSHPPVVLISLSRVGQSFRVYAGCCTRLLAVVKEASKAARVYVLIFKHVEAWAL